MFKIELAQTTSSIVVKYTDITNCLTTIADGQFAVDAGHRSMLVLITHITIPANDTSLFGRFISDVMSYMGKYFNVRVFLRLPMFDRQVDMARLKLKEKSTTAMAVQIVDVRYDDNDTILCDRDDYIFIANKQTILKYSQQLAEMLSANASWISHLNCEDVNNRVESAKLVIMVLDKVNDIPCGFGRLFMMATNGESNHTMGYVDDVVVDSRHHRKGLGWIINNYLMGIKKEEINGTLCLMCVNEGTGTISAPKLYKKAGFEFFPDIRNRIALFVNEQHILHH